MLLDDVGSGPQHEMKGIAQDDIRIDIEKLSRRQALNRAVGSNWHECGRAHCASGKAEHPRACVSIASRHRELHGTAVRV